MKVSLVSFQTKPMKITSSIHLLVQINKASFILGIMLICVTDLQWCPGEDKNHEKQKLKSWTFPLRATLFQSKEKYYSNELKLREIGSLVLLTVEYRKIKAVLLCSLLEQLFLVCTQFQCTQECNALFIRALLPFWKWFLSISYNV